MKNNKGFIGLGLILAIIAVLAIGSGAYYLGTKNNSVPKNIEENLPIENNLSTKNYKNTNAGYSVNYPSNWIINHDTNSPVETRSPTDRQGTPPILNDFEIANMKGAVKSGSDFSMETNGSIIGIQVTHGMKYSTIDDLYKDGAKYGLPANGIQERLANISSMNIGGQYLRVWYGKGGLPDEGYIFIYNGKQYSIQFTSGSQAQYNTDLRVFNDSLASFILTPSTTSTSSEESSSEIFKNQPGEIKSLEKTPSINQWTLAVDLLSRNPNWLPGVDSTGEFFINQNTKIRNLTVTRDTKAYNCGVDMKPDVLENTTTFISNLQKANYKTVYFDIDGENITAMYQQCLP